jgi:tetratricopeptide (TPR) repeat protein
LPQSQRPSTGAARSARQGRPEEAIAAFERALARDPRYAGAYINLADAYRQQGRDAEGEKLLRRGLLSLLRATEARHPYDLE